MSEPRDRDNIHKGHRQRLRSQFLENGLDGLSDINALELLLFYAIPRQDTNPIAHRLLDAFGSLSGVLSASAEELQTVGKLTENAAALLRLPAEITRRSTLSRLKETNVLTDSRDYGSYLAQKLSGLTEETVYVLALDGTCRVLGCKQLFTGSLSAAAVSIRGVAEYALRVGAFSVVLAHNHPSGVPIPSREDVETTRLLSDALYGVGVLLADHVVVAGNQFTSMVAEGFFTPPVLP